MRTNIDDQITIMRDVRNSACGDERQADLAVRAIAQLRAAGARKRMRENAAWARLDTQAVALKDRLAAAEADGDDRQADLARRALTQVLAGMKKLLAGEQTATAGGRQTRAAR